MNTTNDRLTVTDPLESSLATALDHLLHTGVVVAGDLVLSVAGIDLVYCSLRLLLVSADRYDEIMQTMNANPNTQKPEASV